MRNKDVRKIVRQAQRRGWELLPQRGRSHMRMVWKNGVSLLLPISTNDSRAIQNLLHDIRKIEAGEVDRKGRKLYPCVKKGKTGK